jgi:hypothetical protein
MARVKIIKKARRLVERRIARAFVGKILQAAATEPGPRRRDLNRTLPSVSTRSGAAIYSSVYCDAPTASARQSRAPVEPPRHDGTR